MSTPLGLGIAAAHAASSPIHPASSSRIGAPCAAKMTGIGAPVVAAPRGPAPVVPVATCGSVVIVRSSRRAHAHAAIGAVASMRSASRRVIIPRRASKRGDATRPT